MWTYTLIVTIIFILGVIAHSFDLARKKYPYQSEKTAGPEVVGLILAVVLSAFGLYVLFG